MVILVINYYLINTFLGGRFSTYGADVIAYSQRIRYQKEDFFNPMCDAFPTIVNCITNNFGVNGEVQQQSTLCILSQNVINEKIYLFLWFWFVFMYMVAIATFFYYVAIITMPSFRMYQLLYHTRSRHRQQKLINALENNWNHINTIGNWFILNQIGKNSNAYFFRRFISNLTNDGIEIIVHDKKDDLQDKKEGLEEITDTDNLSTGEFTEQNINEKQEGFSLTLKNQVSAVSNDYFS